MSREFTFDPSTNSGVEITGGGQQTEPTSIQERSDLQQSLAFRNTSEMLTQRAAEKAGTDAKQVAGSGNLEVETRLAEVQKELFELNNGTRPHDALRMLTLEGLQNTLAESLITGQEVSEPAPEVQALDEEKQADSLADMRDGMRNDDGIQAALAWGSDNLDEGVISAIQYGLASDDPNTLELTVNNVQELYRGREHVQTYESHADVGEITTDHINYFTENFDAQTAKNIQLINYGIRSGKLSMAEATKQSLKLGILQPMLQAARELPDFNIANF